MSLKSAQASSDPSSLGGGYLCVCCEPRKYFHPLRLLKGACPRYILDALQGTDDGTLTCAKHRVEEWYRPHLGKFLSVDRDGVLCHPEYSGIAPTGQPPELGSELKVDGSGPLLASTDSSTCNDLTGGVFWPNPEKGTHSGERASQMFGTAERLVSRPSPVRRFLTAT